MSTTITFGKPTNFLGRNGYFTASGLAVVEYEHSGVVALAPITSKGRVARCEIEVPRANLAELIAALQEFQSLRERVATLRIPNKKKRKRRP